ncbi:hypothetical protein MMC30_004680 [Trapelia coarctata]|nr:hypothetical protein [Trapelia coarctata]
MADPNSCNGPNHEELGLGSDVLPSREVTTSSPNHILPHLYLSPSNDGHMYQTWDDRRQRYPAPSPEPQQTFQTLSPLNTLERSRSMSPSPSTWLPPVEWTGRMIPDGPQRVHVTDASVGEGEIPQHERHFYHPLHPIEEEPAQAQSQGPQNPQPIVGEPAHGQSHPFETLQPPAQEPDPTIARSPSDNMSIGSDSTIRPHRPQGPRAAKAPTDSSASSSPPSFPSPPASPNAAYTRQQTLFRAILHTCTTTARAYYRSQFHSPFYPPTTIRHPRRHHVTYLFHPYSSQTYYQRQLPARPPRTLIEFTQSISDKFWERALELGDYAAELEATQRMGNFYGWAEKVVGAARGGCGEEEGKVLEAPQILEIVLVARDLVVGLGGGEGGREVVRLWEGWCEDRGFLWGYGI